MILIDKIVAESVLTMPSDADLRRQVRFSSADGRIWLAGQRMVLMHAASLAHCAGNWCRRWAWQAHGAC